jgi:hypothetical protein
MVGTILADLATGSSSGVALGRFLASRPALHP